jgi:hypothetical protein
MSHSEIPYEYEGWWRIVETSQWDDSSLDILGEAIISITGYGDRLRMFTLLANVNCKVIKSGISFTFNGSWEYDPVSGSGNVRLRKDGKLSGKIRIKGGDESSFIAERTDEPEDHIQHPPRLRDKWR